MNLSSPQTLNKLALLTLLLYGLWSCANIGNPEGGPYDMTPPRLIKAIPEEHALEVKAQRMSLHFDEFVQLQNQSEKILISPPQVKAPVISASGKSIYIRLQDSLQPETTYSFYFDDAIVDNNESNPLEHFSYTFSTGSTIDSMQISGVVLDAETLEPIPSVTVGAHYASDFRDSTICLSKPRYASRTDKQGRFTIRVLKDSIYRIYALQDVDNNHLYNLATEGLAIDPKSYRTSLLDSIKTDTIRIDSIVRRDTLYRDSLVTTAHTYYYPNDLVLRYYTARTDKQGLDKADRPEDRMLRLDFYSRPETVPVLKSLDYPDRSAQMLYVATRSQRSVLYWLRDSVMWAMDSLRFALSYHKTDSLGKILEQTDSLTFYKPKSKKTKGREELEGRLRISASSAQNFRASTPADSLVLSFGEPVDVIDRRAIHLLEAKDSVQAEIDFELKLLEDEELSYHVAFVRKHGHKYKLSIDSAGIRSIYGHVAPALTQEQTVMPDAELGALQINLQRVQPNSYIQLLNKSGEAVATLLVPLTEVDPVQVDSVKTNSVEVLFSDLKPEDYYLRLYVDADGDTQWSPGVLGLKEPELMYYSPETYAVKKGFTTAEKWVVGQHAWTDQKPKSLRKAKIEEVKKRVDKNIEYYKTQVNKKKKR